jgi:hypothetical protein
MTTEQQEEEPQSPRADLPRCVECGGRGLGLVTNPQRLCTHCARVTRAFFDPESNRFCRDEGFVDISPSADGGVLKKVAGATHFCGAYSMQY